MDVYLMGYILIPSLFYQIMPALTLRKELLEVSDT